MWALFSPIFAMSRKAPPDTEGIETATRTVLDPMKT
jgi:hypothetical protein